MLVHIYMKFAVSRTVKMLDLLWVNIPICLSWNRIQTKMTRFWPKSGWKLPKSIRPDPKIGPNNS